MSSHGRFILLFFIPFLLAIPLGVANIVFLYNGGELDSVEWISAEQQRTRGLYGSAVHANQHAYYRALYAVRRPKVVVLGSSRALQFRQDHFTARFANLGTTVHFPAELSVVVDHILANGKPELVLIAVDVWWAVSRCCETIHLKNSAERRGGNLTPQALVGPTQWLLDGRVDLALYLNVLNGGHPATAGSLPMYGIQAITRRQGRGPDGSFYYHNEILGQTASKDRRFERSLCQIATNNALFHHREMVSDARLESLGRGYEKLREAGVSVVTFIAPVAPRIFDEMSRRTTEFAYVKHARARLAEIHEAHYDFHDPRVLGADDCEFVNGFHGGDVVAARILAAIYESGEPSVVRVADIERLRRIIRENAGLALADRQYFRDGDAEGDFLDLGCPKDRASNGTAY